MCGGGVPSFGDERDRGAFIEPTVVCGLAEDARCVKEEIFGPICHVAPFDSEEQACRWRTTPAMGSPAAVWTSSLQRAHRVARQMEVGIAWVNDWFSTRSAHALSGRREAFRHRPRGRGAFRSPSSPNP